MGVTTVGNIPFDWIRTYRTSCNLRGNSTTAILRVKWFQTQFFELAMMGNAGWQYTKGGAITRNITRSLPQQHPTKNWQYCVSCDLVEGHGGIWESGSTGLIEFKDLITPKGGPFTQPPNPLPMPNGPGGTYPNSNQATARGDGYADYEVTFEGPLYTIAADSVVTSYAEGNPGAPELIRFVYRQKKRASEDLKLPGNGFVYTSDSKPLLTDLIKMRPTVELLYHWYWVPDPLPETAIGNCVGRVNSVPFDGYASQTLLCLPPDTDKIIFPDGTYGWNVTYHFIYRADSTWNQIYRCTQNAAGPPATSTPYNKFDGVIGKDGSLFFGITDFNLLFHSPPPGIAPDPGDDVDIPEPGNFGPGDFGGGPPVGDGGGGDF